MNKRYQVFVSSTYADLKDERSRVIQTLMEMDCIPSGMELFPAVDEEQFEFIKKVIDDCDYYLLIIGGRYGSTTHEGVSYTEKEYDYAIERGLKVVAFLHQEPDNIPVGKTDKDSELAGRLEAFRGKVQTNRLIKHWKSADELPGLVSLSLTKTIKTYPAIGWIRGNNSSSAELLAEVNDLRKLNEELRTKLSSVSTEKPVAIQNLAGLGEYFGIHGTMRISYDRSPSAWEVTLTFGQIFALISPHLMTQPNDDSVKFLLVKAVLDFAKKTNYVTAEVNDQDFQTIKLQFKALSLVNVRLLGTTKGGMALFWSLTELGDATMTELRAVRKSS